MAPFTLYTGGYEGRIETLAFDPAATPATLKRVAVVQEGAGAAPTWLNLSEDGKTIFSADEWADGSGEVHSWAVGSTGELTKTGAATAPGLWPCHSTLVAHTTPPRLITTTYKGGIITNFPLPLDPTAEAQSINVLGTAEPGPHPTRQHQVHPHGVHLDPLSRVLVVPDLGADRLIVFAVDPSSGLLSPLPDVPLQPGDGPRHVLFDHNRPGPGPTTILYVLNELDNSLSSFSVDYPTDSTDAPTFTPLEQRISLLPPSPVGTQSAFSHWHAAELKVTPDHLTLFASNRAEDHAPLKGTKEGEPDVFAVFDIAPATGKLENRRIRTTFGRAPRHFSLGSESQKRGERAGKYVAIAQHDSNEVIIAELVGESKELKEVARLEGAGRPGIVLWA